MDLTACRHFEGNFICLKEIQETDAADMYRWRSSASGRFMNHPDNYSLESQIAWIKNRPKTEVNYIIYKKGPQPEKVGMISILDIDTFHKKAEVGRLMLDESYLNVSNPFGLEALKITYGIVLNDWKFNKIYGSILAKNAGMIKLQKFLGMDEEGILKKHLFIKNEFVDLHLFAIQAENFNKKYLPRLNMMLKSFAAPPIGELS